MRRGIVAAASRRASWPNSRYGAAARPSSSTKAAFGAIEDYRVGGTDDHEAVVAQLAVGTASFWVSDESPPHRNFSPESLGGATARLLLIVDDPHSVVQRAIAAGASEVYPVTEEHGWLLGRIEDPFGHHWEIGAPLIAWPPSGRDPVRTPLRVHNNWSPTPQPGAEAPVASLTAFLNARTSARVSALVTSAIERSEPTSP
jgi:PhnB protein